MQILFLVCSSLCTTWQNIHFDQFKQSPEILKDKIKKKNNLCDSFCNNKIVTAFQTLNIEMSWTLLLGNTFLIVACAKASIYALKRQDFIN